MTPDGSGAGRPQRLTQGAQKKGRTRTRKARTYAAVAGGAVACTGVAFGVSTPIAEAFSIVIPVNSGGSGNSVQVNILEGNVFDPQLGLLTGNSSNNTTGGGIATGQGSGTGATVGSGNGNVTQIDILSYNIINPQASIFGSNFSNNTTVSNVASGNGNGVNNQAASDNVLGGMLLAGMSGNGNTTQVAFLSGNILNPQSTLFGANISNNTSEVNQANGNGNGSTQYLSAGYLAGTLFGGMNGNGNTTQVAGGAGNIFNPQLSFGLGNTSSNSTSTNDSSGNGNYSGNGGSSGLFGNTTIFGQSGNGNTSQTSTSSGSIFNDQYNFGIGNLFSSIAPTPTQVVQQQVTTPTNQSGTDSIVTASTVQSPVTSGTVTTPAVTAPDPVDTSVTAPASTTSAGSRITTVVNSLGGNLKTGSTPLLPTGGTGGTPGHFSIPEPIKKILASIPGMPSASSAPSTSDSSPSAGTG